MTPQIKAQPPQNPRNIEINERARSHKILSDSSTFKLSKNDNRYSSADAAMRAVIITRTKNDVA